MKEKETLRKKMLKLLIALISIFAVLFYLAYKSSLSPRRDINQLFVDYYRLKEKHPWEAKEALELILAEDPHHVKAILALNSWYLQQGNTHAAVKLLKNALQHHPANHELNLALAHLYLRIGQAQKAQKYLEIAKIKEPKKTTEQLADNKKIKKRSSTEPEKLSYIEPVNSVYTGRVDLLLSQYLALRKIDSPAVQRYLNTLIETAANKKRIYLELAYIALKQDNTQIAIQYFEKAYTEKKDAQIAAQLGYLYVKLKDFSKAKSYFQFAAASDKEPLRTDSLKALEYLNRLEAQTTEIAAVPLSLKQRLMQAFYQQKKTSPANAWTLIEKLAARYPKDIQILKEAAYLAESLKMKRKAIEYWKRAFCLEYNAEYAINIAYLYDSLDLKTAAFFYFDVATRGNDPKIRLKAEKAKTNMGGSQTRFFPKPFFSELYTSPLYYSRFDLGILPIISRTGVVLNDKYQAELYFSYRRTQDTKSGVFGFTAISQIFEDNVAIYALGGRFHPVPKIPLVLFLEVGRAQDLVQRFRPKWRNDVRGGAYYFNRWGLKQEYVDRPEMPMKYVASLYADAIYYSRYDNNIIAAAVFRPGLRLWRYKAASIDGYLANYLIRDKNKDFFNNVYSVGPGIAIQPSNRWNVIFRYESLQGFYIPVSSPTPNPYAPGFYNQIVMVELFSRF